MIKMLKTCFWWAKISRFWRKKNTCVADEARSVRYGFDLPSRTFPSHRVSVWTIFFLFHQRRLCLFTYAHTKFAFDSFFFYSQPQHTTQRCLMVVVRSTKSVISLFFSLLVFFLLSFKTKKSKNPCEESDKNLSNRQFFAHVAKKKKKMCAYWDE